MPIQENNIMQASCNGPHLLVSTLLYVAQKLQHMHLHIIESERGMGCAAPHPRRYGTFEKTGMLLSVLLVLCVL